MSKNFFEQRMAQRGGDTPFSVSGKIRAGTKAISKKASANPGAAKLFQDCLEGKLSFQAAEKQIAEQFQVRNPFYPRNTQEYHAHAWDMGAGGKAVSDKLLKLYGESVNGGPTKLYRFPIVFPEVGSDLSAVIQGGMAVQGGGANTVRYWSAFDDTGIQMCKHLPEVAKSPMSQRRTGKPIRHPERKPVTRGPCVPEECNEFAMGMCRFSGKVRFYIPGIPGAGMFELSTGSTVAATDIYLRLMQAFRALNGKMRNYTPDGRPIFWLTKKKAMRNYFDEEGNQKRGEQWVPELEMEIEMPRVIMLQEMRHTQEGDQEQQQKPQLPSAWTEPADMGQAENSRSFDDGVVDTVITARQGKVEPTGGAAAEATPSPQTQRRAEQPVAQAASKTTCEPAAPPPAGDSIQQMKSHAERLGYQEELEKWVELKYGGDHAAAHQFWLSLSERYNARLKDYLQLSLLILEQGLNGDTVMKYLKIKFGPIGAGAKLAEMLADVRDLCNDGASVAMSVMEELVEDATA